MFCSKCGKAIADDSQFCQYCGNTIRGENLGNESELNSNNINPVEQKRKYNVMCIVGFVIALVSLLLNFWGIVGIAALIISLLGFMQTKPRNEKGKGLAIAGMAIGGYSIIYAVIMILYAMGML